MVTIDRPEGTSGGGLAHEPHVPPGPRPGTGTAELGRIGEQIACRLLDSRGYTVLWTNYLCPYGEADIICYDESTEEVVFVEVKARRAQDRHRAFWPELAVDAAKRDRYRKISRHFAREHHPVRRMRCDVIAVQVDDLGASLRHYRNAFPAGEGW